MARKSKADLDETDKKMLRMLQENARIKCADLGRALNLTDGAIIARLRRMEDSGFITGYHAVVEPTKVDLKLVFISVALQRHDSPDHFRWFVKQQPEVLECYALFGEADYMLKAVVSSDAHLRKLLEKIHPYGRTECKMVFFPVITYRVIDRNEEGWLDRE
jgi:Lrp/AsnC family leucine-responsive transcriptional regulator